MYQKFSSSFIFILICIFFVNASANPSEAPPKKWPCDQVYNPKLNLGAIWQGPPIDDALKNWWKDDDIIEYVNLLSDPVLKEEDGLRIIEEFAKKHTYFGLIKKRDQKDKLVFLFAGLYQKAKDRRSRQYSGIIKFVERQNSFRKAIGQASKLIRKYRKDKLDIKDQRFVDASSKLEWNTRVFDQRTRLTEYICEEPVFNTQRLGYQSRKIYSYIQ
ncbi:MAG: hypothetical protein CMM95_02755 [Rickettsiales bacterium]|nr:hypothetical protein [Rickettsiales bacterium]